MGWQGGGMHHQGGFAYKFFGYTHFKRGLDAETVLLWISLQVG